MHVTTFIPVPVVPTGATLSRESPVGSNNLRHIYITNPFRLCYRIPLHRHPRIRNSPAQAATATGQNFRRYHHPTPPATWLFSRLTKSLVGLLKDSIIGSYSPASVHRPTY